MNDSFPSSPHAPRSGGDGSPERIAVVGMACRFPGAPDVDAFWRNLREGVESISFFSDEELLRDGNDPALLAHPRFVRAFGYLEGADLFDADFFDLSPRDAEAMDPQHRLFLEEAWAALEHAGCDPESCPGPIGVFAGSNMNSYLLGLVARHGTRGADFLHNRIRSDKDFLATLVSYKLNLRGPSFSVQTACSTSLVAVHLAAQSLLDFQCDVALAGGVSVSVPLRSGHLHQEGSIFSPDGHCRAFDARAGGTVGGSGVGVVVLKRLSDAIADGDRVHAVLLGSAVNNDGAQKVGYTAPSVEGQMEVVTTAHAVAEVDPETITYVEAHGTGTPMGDPIEVAALTEAFGTRERGYCALGSVKTNVGHLDAAAGVAGLIKTVLALRHAEIPPSLHFREANPKIDFAASPFHVADRLRPWSAPPGVPRRAGVSSFGVGGTNAHVVLEEAPPLPEEEREDGFETVVLSARTPAALERMSTALAEHLERHPGLHLADVAFTLRTGRKAFPHRRALAARSTAEAAALLRGRGRLRTVTGTAADADPGVVFLFPGEGSGRPGAGSELYASEPAFREAVDRCADLLRSRHGLDLRAVLRGESRDPLLPARVSHAALFATGYALAELWKSRGVTPRAVAGHGLGEYVAACVAGVLPLDDALALVVRRGELLDSLPAVETVVVTLEVAEARRLVEEISSPGEPLRVTAVNAAHSCVASGAAAGVARLAERVREAGGVVRPLAVPHPLYSEALAPLREAFAGVVASVSRRAPEIPLASGATGEWLRPEEAESVEHWVRHLTSPVRFDRCVALLRAGREEPVLLEVGAGGMLGDWARLHGASRVAASLPAHGSTDPEAAALRVALGCLWTRGVGVDWTLRSSGAPRRVPLPGHPLQRRRFWIDALPGAGARAEDGGALRLYTPAWTQLSPPARSVGEALAGERFVAFTGPSGTPLLEGLRALGAEVVRVEAGEEFREGAEGFVVRPGAGADYLRLAEALREGRTPVHTLHLWSVEQDEAAGGGGGEMERGARALHRWLEAGAGLLAEGSAVLVATRGAQAVLGSEPLVPGRAALTGLLRGLPLDRPGLSTRSVDVDRCGEWHPHLPAEVVDLLRGEAGPAEVAYRGRRRWTPRYEEVSAAGGRPLRVDGAYLVLGGDAGPGLAIARHLEARGGRVAVVPAGAADPRALGEALAGVRERFGALHGVVHAAGVESVPALDEALGDAPLDFLLLCSSSAGARAAEDGAAGAFLDALALERSYGRGLPTLSVRWNGWEDPVGGEILERVLAYDGSPQAVVSAGDPGVLPERARSAPGAPPPHPPKPDLPAGGRHPRPPIGTPYAAPRTELEEVLVEIYGRELRIEPVGVDDDFFEIGGDSLLATQLVAAVNEAFQVELPLQAVFEAPTPARLAPAIVRKQAEQVDEDLLAQALAEL